MLNLGLGLILGFLVVNTLLLGLLVMKSDNESVKGINKRIKDITGANNADILQESEVKPFWKDEE